jgi:hypothetical protein
MLGYRRNKIINSFDVNGVGQTFYEIITQQPYKFTKNENLFGMHREQRFHNLSYFFEEQKISKDEFFDINNKRPYVIKYKIKHDDLILDLSGYTEKEVVVDNEKAKIISYFLPRY